MIKDYYVKRNDNYKEDYNLVVGIEYGIEGILACHKNSSDNGCVSSSGDSICGCYMGHEKINLSDGNCLFIVRCYGEVKCGS